MPHDDEYVDPEYLSDPEEVEGQLELPMDTDEPEPKRAVTRKPTTREKKAAALPVGQIEDDGTLHGLIKVTRSLSLGSRNDQIHLGMEWPVVVQPGWTLPMQAIAAADAFGMVRSVVYGQLGLDFTVTEDGIVQEVIKAFPGAEKVQERRERDEEPRRNGHGEFPHPADIDRPSHIDREVWADLVEHYDDWYDNRKDKASGKYKDTAPDFKRAEDSETIWLRPYRRESSRSRR